MVVDSVNTATSFHNSKGLAFGGVNWVSDPT